MEWWQIVGGGLVVWTLIAYWTRRHTKVGRAMAAHDKHEAEQRRDPANILGTWSDRHRDDWKQ